MKRKTGDRVGAGGQRALSPDGGAPTAGKYALLDDGSADVAGVQYRGRHVLLDVPVTVTVLAEELTHGPERLARLQERVRGAAALRHDHIVSVLDLGEERARYHVVEAFVDATPLDQLLRATGALSPAAALHVARQLADALAHAHERGVVHGALTPASVLLEQGTPPRALIAGFATAALPWQEATVPAPLLSYAAPERLADGDLDGRADVFALGLVLFEMLEGQAFLAGGEQEIRELLHGTAPLLPRFSRIAPAGVPALVARALRRRPAERHPSMADLRADIDACLRRLGQAPAQAAATNPVSPATDPRPRRCVMVVDDTVGDDADEAALADETSASSVAAGAPAAKRRSPGVAGGIVVTVGPRTRRMPAGGTIVAALVMLGLALGWPLLRSPAPAPAPAMTEEVAAAPAPAGPPGEAVSRESVVAAVAAPADGPEASPDPEPMRNRAPRIVSRRPAARDRVRVAEGQSVELSVRATDRNPDDRLTYVWLVDGRRQKTSGGPRWRFVAPYGEAGATHTVEVEVSDRAGLKAPRASWTLDVLPRMSEVNVRDWLERLALAWERKDIATLRLYGIVTGEADAAAVRQRVPWFGGYHVSTSNETIRTDGPYASVAFDHVEADGRGRVLASTRESYHLEKHPNGFVALRAR